MIKQQEEKHLIVSGHVFVRMGREIGRRIKVIQSRFGSTPHLQQVARVGEFSGDLDILATGAVQEIRWGWTGIGTGRRAVASQADSDAEPAWRMAIYVAQTCHQLFTIVNYVH